MKSVLVIGMGTMGIYLAKKMQALGNEVMIIDKNEELIQELSPEFSDAVCSDCTQDGILRSIGVNTFDYCFVTTGEDFYASLEITSILKELGAKYVVAKAKRSRQVEFLKKIGADRIVFPESDMGVRLAQTLSSSNIIDYIEISENYSIIETATPKKWIGNSIKKLDIRARYGINILAIKGQDGRTVSVTPSPDYIIKAGDILVVVGSNDDLQNLE